MLDAGFRILDFRRLLSLFYQASSIQYPVSCLLLHKGQFYDLWILVSPKIGIYPFRNVLFSFYPQITGMNRRREVFCAKSWCADSWAGQAVGELARSDCARILFSMLATSCFYLFFFSSSVFSRISMTARSLGRPRAFLL